MIIPAIDILDGECVRLTRGDYSTKKVYASDPAKVAKQFEALGAPMLHVVDLNGAKDGEPENRDLILKIVRSVKIPVQVGGGVRELSTIKEYAKAGISRVVLGTRAVLDLTFLQQCLKEFGAKKIVVGVDARNGQVATHGWQQTTSRPVIDFCKDLKDLGIQEIVFTDITRDGTLTSPNFDAMEMLVKLGFNVVASGGISDLKSLKRLRELGVFGAILGKALYENKMTLPEALQAVSPPSNLTKRIIPCLDVKNGRVVKGVQFVNLRDAGDPVELGERYSCENADELVFLDIAASQEERKTMVELVSRVAEDVFIPFTVGGGIKSVEEIRILLQHGADKVSLNTSAVQNRALIQEASEVFGSQCIVVAIDVKRRGSEHKVFIKGGDEETSLEAVGWAEEVEKLGAGEILLTSMDQDGTKQGFDLEILRKVTHAVNIPVIASGGAGSLEDLKDAIVIGGADAVLSASLFHQHEMTIQEAKLYLKSQGLPVRL